MELFDILDCAGRKTGGTVLRDEAHRTGVWHGAFHCIIIYQREGKRYGLFQKRSSQKAIAPDRFDVSVGGHYAAGEDAAVAGPRECREELGIDISYHELLPLGRRVFVYCFTPGVVEQEFQDVFMLEREVTPDRLALQRDEVAGVLEMDIDQGIELFSGDASHAECMLYGPEPPGNRVIVTRDSFVPCLDNYYLKLLLLARRYWSGDRAHLVI